MGRLKWRKRLLRLIRAWAIPVAVALVTIFAVHLTLANPEPTAQELQEYLQSNVLGVGTETIDGYQQVFYSYRGNRIYVSEDEQVNHTNPVVSGQYIVWVELQDKGGQILVHDAVSKTTTRLTSDSTNRSPSISGNRVVWEKWVNDGWQIYYYDGMNVEQLSDSSGVAIRAKIEGNRALYAEYTGSNWRVVQVDLGDDQASIVTQGDETQAWPDFGADGEITTTLPEAL